MNKRRRRGNRNLLARVEEIRQLDRFANIFRRSCHKQLAIFVDRVSDASMESFLKVNGSKYLVFINDTLMSPCTVSNESSNFAYTCPAYSYCLVNASWSAVPSQCVCKYWLGLSGPECLTPIPVWTAVLFTQGIMIILISIFVCGILIIDSIRLRHYLKSSPLSAFSTTMISCILSSVFLASYYIDNFAALNYAYNENFGLVALAITFFCMSFTTLNVSLIWWEIAFAVQTMSLKVSKNVRRYRNILVLYYILFFFLICYFIAMNETPLFQVVCVPSLAYISISYFIAYFRIKRIAPKEKLKVDTSRYQIEVQNIARAALRIAFFVTLALIGFVIVVVEKFVFNLQDFPDRTPVELPSRFISLSLSLVMASIANYLHESAKRKLNFTSHLKTPHVSAKMEIEVHTSSNGGRT